MKKIDVLSIIFIQIKSTIIQFLSLIYCLKKTPKFISIFLFDYIYRVFYKSSSIDTFEQSSEAKDSSENCYGETLIPSLIKLGRYCKLTNEDLVLDLGSGNGRSCFFLNLYFKCHCLGYENITNRYDAALSTKTIFSMNQSQFKQDTFFNATQDELRNAKLIYITSTCLSPSTRETLWELLLTCSRHTFIASVTHRINNDQFKLDHFFLKLF